MKDKVKDILATILEIDISKIDDSSSSETLEEWDSLKHMNFILALEEEFNVAFDDEEIMAMLSFDKVCEVLSQKT